MRLTGIDIYSGETLRISTSLRDINDEDRFLLKAVIGLDADEITSKFRPPAYFSYAKHYHASMPPREIVMRMVLNPNYSVNESPSSLRDDVYRLVSPDLGGRLTLHMKSGAHVISAIKAYTTKVEVPYFSKIPEVQITFKCDGGLFRGIAPIKFNQTDNPELFENNPIVLPESESTAPHGFAGSIQIKTGTYGNWTLQDHATSPTWKFKIGLSGSTFSNGDVIQFNSDPGQRYLYRDLAGGGTEDLMDKLSADSSWPILFPGNNEFYQFLDNNVYNASYFDWIAVSWYSARWGI